MSDKGYIKFGIFAGIGVGVVSSIPFLNWANLCCCLPIAIGGGAGVSLYLKGDQTRTMTTVNAALVGMVAAITAIPVYFLLNTVIYLTLLFLAPGAYEFLLTWGMRSLEGEEILGFPVLSAPAMLLSVSGTTLMLGLVFLVVAPLGAIASLHLFHKERIATT